MNEVRVNEVQKEEEGQRLDNYLIRILKGVPKSRIYRLIRSGEVRVNKKRASPDTRLCIGDLVRIPPVRIAPAKTIFVGTKLASKLNDSIIYEDSELLVLNKPSGIAVHGGSGLSLGVIEAFRQARSDIKYLELVHRLDKETSGCLLLAKKRSILRSIQALLESRTIEKKYWALLINPWDFKKNLVMVDKPLKKNLLKSGERIVSVNEEGKPSQTTFQLIENFAGACLVEAVPKTGRTHQIRVHSAFINHPIIGDEKYGCKDDVKKITHINKLYLHAKAIQFNLNGKNYSFNADLDVAFKETLALLRAGSHDLNE